MIQKRIDDTADKYMMLTNSDRREKLRGVKRAEEIVSTFGFVIFIVVFCYVGIGGWMSFFYAEVGMSRTGLPLEYVFFPIVFFIEVAAGRTAKTPVLLWIFLFTSLLGAIVTHGIYFIFVLYSLLFIFVETKMMAMRIIPGYPAFEDTKINEYDMDLTVEQLAAYEKKKYNDLNDVEGARTRDSANLDKILSGEMNLDEFLGVEKTDRRIIKMDDSMEYHGPQVTSQEEPEADDSVEAFFRKYEKQDADRRGLKMKEKEIESWLEGGDDNSAESYFGKFKDSGGKLDAEASFKSKITFDRAKNNPNGDQ